MNSNDLALICSCLDLTSLNSTDTPAAISTLCQTALSVTPQPATVCVFPCFIEQCHEELKGSGIGVTTVAGGFPHGMVLVSDAASQVAACVEAGAHDVDIVFPRYLANTGDVDSLKKLVSECCIACGDRVLKVILGTGELDSPDVIYKAAMACCEAGAGFVKTSTGKEKVNATPEAFTAMARAVHDYFQTSGRRVGLKAAGGVSTPEVALQYLDIARTVAGQEWASPLLFRIGASGLLQSLQAALKETGESVAVGELENAY